MLEEIIKVKNYIEAIRLLHEKNKEYDVLIDFHDRKKWIASKNIALTLISPDETQFIHKYKDPQTAGRYVRNKKDNSIEYICDNRGRFEYYCKDGLENGILNSFHLEERAYHRDFMIGVMNQASDTFVDNGENKDNYDSPYVIPFSNYGNNMKSNPFLIKKRINGVIELYDRETEDLKYVCNIGKRYEYYFKGEYKNNIVKYTTGQNDTIIQLIPDKSRVWIQLVVLFDSINNPYIVKSRDDGGVDLLSKEDGSLKYICNIGKRFYYISSEEDTLYF